MNSALMMMDTQVTVLKNKIDGKLIIRFTHKGFSNFIKDSIELIQNDVYLHEQEPESYEKETRTDQILSKLDAIFNDLKNALLLKKLNPELLEFFNTYLVLVNNWNSMKLNDSKITENINATVRLMDLYDSFETLIQKVGASLNTLEVAVGKLGQNSNLVFRTSSTYFKEIHDDIKKDEE